jgi:hypothetical protein
VRTLAWQMMISLDGFIEGPNREMNLHRVALGVLDYKERARHVYKKRRISRGGSPSRGAVSAGSSHKPRHCRLRPKEKEKEKENNGGEQSLGRAASL